MIKAIIFDCFGVLTTDLWLQFVATLPQNQVGEARALNGAYDAAIIDHKTFLREIQALTGHKPQEIEKLLDREIYKNTQLISNIKVLKQDYKIGLLSNIATNWVRETLLTKDEQKLFDVMTLSFEVQLAKPDPKIFELTSEKLGVAAQSCLMIDDQARNLEGAHRAGMQTLNYINNEQLMQDLPRELK